MKKYLIVLFLLFLFFIFPSCKEYNPSAVTPTPFSVENSFSFDGVKLIAKEIEDGTHESTFSQKHYIVNYDRRLLMRFESLSAHEKEVDASKPVKLVIGIYGDQRASDVGYLTVCPIERDWMMLATWRNAHPFGLEGKWQIDGGDYENTGCVTGVIGSDYPERKAATVEFDVSRWFLDYPRGKQINYGLILLSKNDVLIGGEKNYFPPRITFSEWHK